MLHSWIFLFLNHRLSSNEAYRPCSQYTLQQGYTAGCLLEVEKDEVLYFSIRNGTHPLLSKSLWISSYRTCFSTLRVDCPFWIRIHHTKVVKPSLQRFMFSSGFLWGRVSFPSPPVLRDGMSQVHLRIPWELWTPYWKQSLIDIV